MPNRVKSSKNYSSISLNDRLSDFSVQFLEEFISPSNSTFLLPSRVQSQQEKILYKLGPIATKSSIHTNSSITIDTGNIRSGYIVSFVIIFIIVLFIIVGRVIYSSNESAAPNIAFLKYHRASTTATALNDRLQANNGAKHSSAS